jgi:hypothetical protein
LCGRADYRRIGVAKKRFWTDGKPQEVAWADHAFQARCSSAQSAPVLAARRGEVIDVARALARLAVGKASEGGGSVTESSTAPVLSDRDGEEGGWVHGGRTTWMLGQDLVAMHPRTTLARASRT